MYCVQLPSGLTSFRSISIKPYFWPENTHNIELDKLEATAKPDELKATAELDKLEVAAKPDELEVTAKSDKLEVPLPTLEVP